MESLKAAAEIHKFRQPNEGESEPDFRYALADHVVAIDFIESEEIRTGHGWNKFTPPERHELLGQVAFKSR
jgi:hypothetical protein